MAELKPCECKCTSISLNECGYTGLGLKLYYYSCPYCGKVSFPQTSKKKAIDAWNKRS